MDRFQLAEKLLPFSEPGCVCLMDGNTSFGWLYNAEQCKKAIECWRAGTLSSVSFITKDKKGRKFNIDHPVRLGIVPHYDEKVSYFALDFDAHEGQESNVHQLPAIAKFFHAEPVQFHSKSGQGIRAIFILPEPMDVNEFISIIRSWGFNRTGRVELFPKTGKLTQFWLPNDPNLITGGDSFISGSWESAIAALPPIIPAQLTNTTLDFMVGLIAPGSRHNTLYAAARELGSKRTEEKISLKLLLQGATLCGLGKSEADQTARDGYAQGTADEKKQGSTQKKPYSADITLTDTWNAQFLAQNFGNDIKFDHTHGIWMVWNGQRWVPDEKGLIVEHAKESAHKIIDIAKNYSFDPDFYKKILNHHIKSLAKASLYSCLELSKSLTQIATITSEFNFDPLLFNCQNGTIDLKSGTLRAHCREDKLSKITDIPFDKSAKIVAWQDNLNLIFAGNAELIAFVQRIMGLCLSGEVSEQILIFFFGGGKNGKSLFISTMEMILGDYFLRCPATMLMACKHEGIPNDIARLPGVRMAVCSELDEGMRFNESLVKDLTGNDTVTARFLHQEFFDFKPSHKLFICGNSKPRVIGTDTGIWRRMILIPFTVEIPADRRKPIAEMLTIFRKEASGILNWMLEGYQAYKKDGLDIPQEVHAATAQYRSASDVVGYYLNENCNIGSALTISISDLYLDYKAWTREAGEFTLSKRRFGEHLVDRGFTKTRGTGGTWLWEGLGSKMNGNPE